MDDLNHTENPAFALLRAAMVTGTAGLRLKQRPTQLPEERLHLASLAPRLRLWRFEPNTHDYFWLVMAPTAADALRHVQHHIATRTDDGYGEEEPYYCDNTRRDWEAATVEHLPRDYSLLVFEAGAVSWGSWD